MDFFRHGSSLIVFILAIKVSRSDIYADTFYMKFHCGTQIVLPPNLQGGEVILNAFMLSPSLEGRCSLTLTAPNSRLALQLTSVNLGADCTTSLQVSTHYPDTLTVGGFNNKKKTICSDADADAFTSMSTNGDSVLLNFTSGDPSNLPMGNIRFELTFARFTTARHCTADRDRRLCRGKTRCVHTDIWCKGFNPCGDNSDKCDDTVPRQEQSSGYQFVIGIVVACVLFVIMALSIFLYLRKRQALSSARRNQAQSIVDVFARLRDAMAADEEEVGIDGPAMRDPPPEYGSLEHLEQPPPYSSVMSNQDVYKISGAVVIDTRSVTSRQNPVAMEMQQSTDGVVIGTHNMTPDSDSALTDTQNVTTRCNTVAMETEDMPPEYDSGDIETQTINPESDSAAIATETTPAESDSVAMETDYRTPEYV